MMHKVTNASRAAWRTASCIVLHINASCIRHPLLAHTRYSHVVLLLMMSVTTVINCKINWCNQPRMCTILVIHLPNEPPSCPHGSSEFLWNLARYRAWFTAYGAWCMDFRFLGPGALFPVFSLRVKNNVYSAMVLSVLLHESWALFRTQLSRLETLHNSCLRCITRDTVGRTASPPRISWSQLPIGIMIKERRLRWLGHAARRSIWSSNLFLLRGYPDMCNLLDGLVALGCIML